MDEEWKKSIDDMFIHGMGIMADGKRIPPEDFKSVPYSDYAALEKQCQKYREALEDIQKSWSLKTIQMFAKRALSDSYTTGF